MTPVVIHYYKQTGIKRKYSHFANNDLTVPLPLPSQKYFYTHSRLYTLCESCFTAEEDVECHKTSRYYKLSKDDYDDVGVENVPSCFLCNR
ncbi:hypothetical protein ManeNPV_00016 [Malacosoma neustria nucleopolyhedrovirus]|uniref:hypothetical protein n=1 Tax=Malacosoma neustria nuclear polyhedrosis virus TaxID=38012 RepID=UPI000E35EFF0|nr:hypothetical protein ManeNPV_00016 [Malacosoma neustria nucleopolyhedrovirus]AUF81544.1 hypothetical protein ManeNPV_00016 [Malacosoma neustria nucleopolyhedrovirus]